MGKHLFKKCKQELQTGDRESFAPMAVQPPPRVRVTLRCSDASAEYEGAVLWLLIPEAADATVATMIKMVSTILSIDAATITLYLDGGMVHASQPVRVFRDGEPLECAAHMRFHSVLRQAHRSCPMEPLTKSTGARRSTASERPAFAGVPACF